MEAFYSSDEEVAWGPVSLREIKGDLKKPLYRKPQRRYTSHCVVSSNNRAPEVHFKMVEPVEIAVVEDNQIPDISSYLTASEVGHAKSKDKYQNDSLLEYHSAVENFSVSKSSNLVSENSVYYSGTDLEKPDKGNALNHNDISHINFVKNAMERQSDYIFEDESQKLVDNSVISPDKCFTNVNSSSKSYTDNFDINTPGNIIEISSDEESGTGEYEIQEIGKQHNEFGYDTDNVKVEDIHKYESCQEGVHNIKDAANYSTSSAISLPEIDLQQFNDSSDCPLDDTIEKINAILKQADISSDDSFNNGEDARERDKENLSRNYLTEISNGLKKEDYPESFNLISGSFLQKPASGLTPVRHHTPIKYRTPSKTQIPLLKKSPNSFRVPSIPTKLKSGQKTPKPNLKDIVSPIRMYINYSPKPILKQNVHPVDKKISNTNLSFKVPDRKQKENNDILPPVMYKPSKRQVLASEKNICLPASIKKMVVESNVIKSEKKQYQSSLFKNMSLDADSELTKTSLSESQLSEADQNMSVLYKATALRK